MTLKGTGNQQVVDVEEYLMGQNIVSQNFTAKRTTSSREWLGIKVI